MNTVGYFNYQYQTFDENPVIQSTVADAFANFGRFYNVIGFPEPPWYRLYLPHSHGLFVKRLINGRSAIRVNMLLRYWYDKTSFVTVKKNGQSEYISYSAISIDYVHNILRPLNEKLWINSFIGAKGRSGINQNYLDAVLPFYVPERQKLRDFGINLGANATYYGPFNLALTAEIGYSRWLFLKYNHKDNPSNEWGLPRNSFDMRVSLGYTFGKKVKTLREEALEQLKAKE